MQPRAVVTALTFIMLAAAHAQDREAEALQYLSQYGYIETEDDTGPILSQFDISVLNDAVKRFQDFAGLEKTGQLDKQTRELMQTPRCGVEDKIANFVLVGRKWQKKDLTYRISKYPSSRDLNRQDVDLAIRQALSMWQEASNLRFQVRNFGPVDIDISFERRDHGDRDPFDGRGNVLAHAFFPLNGGNAVIDGDAHFDDSEDWSVTPYVGTHLLATITHELGHSLGLRHSEDRNSVMAPFYKGWDPNLRLEEDDKKGIQSLYGDPLTSTTTTTRKPTVNFPGFDIKEIPTDLCNSKIDALVTTSDGTSYVFKEDNYWMLTADSVASGYPRRISQDWSELPGNIDAAFTWQTTRNTYFFKGDKYWSYQGKSPLPGYPKDIANWPGLPANLDAALEWGKDGHLYFFKGSLYWKYDTDLQRMSGGYPRDISDWKNVPYNVDAAFQYSNGKTYFFKGGKYWRLDDQSAAVDGDNFPRDAGKWWFGCKEENTRLEDIGGFVRTSEPT